MSDSIKVSVRLSKSVYDALINATKYYGRSKSDIIKEALISWLEDRNFLKRGV